MPITKRRRWIPGDISTQYNGEICNNERYIRSKSLMPLELNLGKASSRLLHSYISWLKLLVWSYFPSQKGEFNPLLAKKWPSIQDNNTREGLPSCQELGDEFAVAGFETGPQALTNTPYGTIEWEYGEIVEGITSMGCFWEYGEIVKAKESMHFQRGERSNKEEKSNGSDLECCLLGGESCQKMTSHIYRMFKTERERGTVYYCGPSICLEHRTFGRCGICLFKKVNVQKKTLTNHKRKGSEKKRKERETVVRA